MMRDVERSNGVRRAPAPAAAAHPARSRDDMSYRAGPLERMPKQSSSWEASAPHHRSSGTNNKVAGWRRTVDADVPSALTAAAFIGGAVAAANSPDQTGLGRVGHALASWSVATVVVVGAAALISGVRH